MEFQLLKYKKRINKNIYKQKAILNKLNWYSIFLSSIEENVIKFTCVWTGQYIKLN